MNKSAGIWVELERCVGCRSCELACAVAHSRSGTLAGAVGESPPPLRRIFVEGDSSFRGPVHCRHCDPAPCMDVCPSAALFREPVQGWVMHREERCLSCHLCTLACPFGVIRAGPNGRLVAKCDGCREAGFPACVKACPTGALRYETEARFEQRRRSRMADRWWSRPWSS